MSFFSFQSFFFSFRGEKENEVVAMPDGGYFEWKMEEKGEKERGGERRRPPFNFWLELIWGHTWVYTKDFKLHNRINNLLSNNWFSILGGKACWRSSKAEGRSDGLWDIKRRNKDACSENSVTQAVGSSPFCFKSDRTRCLSIAVPKGCQSSKKTIPKLYISACNPQRLNINQPYPDTWKYNCQQIKATSCPKWT